MYFGESSVPIIDEIEKAEWRAPLSNGRSLTDKKAVNLSLETCTNNISHINKSVKDFNDEGIENNNKKIKTNDNFINSDGFEDNNCKNSVNTQFRFNQQEVLKQEKQRELVDKQIRTLVIKNSKELPTDDSLKDFLKIVVAKQRVVGFYNEAGELNTFLSRSRINPAYEKKASSQIQDCIKDMVDDEREIVALTLTCDVKRYNNDRRTAWKVFYKDTQGVIELFRKHYNATYVKVVESTKKGYPHWHVVLGFPKGSIKGYAEMKNRQKIFFGDLYKKIKERVKSQIFHLEVLKGANVRYYLTKYITKNSEMDYKKLSNQKQPFTESERKAILCLFYSWGTHTRTYSFSNKLRKNIVDKLLKLGLEKEAQSWTVEKKVADFEKVQKEIEMFDTGKHVRRVVRPSVPYWKAYKSAARLRAYLIKICTNSPCLSATPVKVVSKNVFEKEIGCEFEPKRTQDGDYKASFELHARNRKCSGCYYRELSLKLRGLPSIFDDFEWELSDGTRIPSFDKNRCKNDLYFIRQWLFFASYISLNIAVYGRSLKDIAEMGYFKYVGDYKPRVYELIK